MRLFTVADPITVRFELGPDPDQFAWSMFSSRSALGDVGNASAPRPSARARDVCIQRDLVPTEAGGATAATVYLATPFDMGPLAHASVRAGMRGVLRLVSEHAATRVLATVGAPPRLGYAHRGGGPRVRLADQVAALGARRHVRVAVVNSFHPALGDTMVATTMLREVRRVLEAQVARVRIELFQTPYNPGTALVYERCRAVDAVHPLPASLSELLAFDAFFDFSEGRLPAGVPWPDAFFDAAGIDPASVPVHRRRNQLTIAPDVRLQLAQEVANVRSRGRPIVLLHTKASTPLRSVPRTHLNGIVSGLLDQTDGVIVSVEPLDGVRASTRVVDWSDFSRTLDHFAFLISQADMFVSVDTSVFHVADALDVPGVVLFTTQRPSWRIRDYPFVSGMLVGSDTVSDDEGGRTPVSAETARSATDGLLGLDDSADSEVLARCHRSWDRLDMREVKRHLDLALARKAAALGGAPSPCTLLC